MMAKVLHSDFELGFAYFYTSILWFLAIATKKGWNPLCIEAEWCHSLGSNMTEQKYEKRASFKTGIPVQGALSQMTHIIFCW